MIRLHVIHDFEQPGIMHQCAGKEAAATAARLFTKEAKGIIARIDTDDELIALDIAVNARNAKAMERAAGQMIGQVLVTVWQQAGKYVDGAGWRIIFSPAELEGQPAPRPASGRG